MSWVMWVWLVLAQAGVPLQLADCLREALARHPDLALARTDVQAAQAAQKGTRAGYLPRLDLRLQDGYLVSGDFEYQMGPSSTRIQGDDNDFHSFGLYLSQNLLDGGKWWTRPKRAARETARVETVLAATGEDVALGVIQAYYALARAERELEVLQESLALSEAQLRLAEERYRLGAGSRVDSSKARLGVGEDRIAIERQRTTVEQAQVDLNLAIGREPNAPCTVGPQPPVEGLLPDQPAEVRSDHVRLQAQEAAQAVADLDLELALAERWPTVSGSINYTRQDAEFYKVYSRFDEIYNLTFSLTVAYPIFEGFATSAAIEQAEAHSARVSAERQRVQQELDARLAKALQALQRLQTIEEVERDNVRAAEDSLALERERYSVGEGTALEMRDAQLSLTRAQLALVQTGFELLGAVAAYHYARGDLLAVYLPEERP